MGLVFISYRRLDSAGHAGKVYDFLGTQYPRDQLFLDTGDLKPGDAWSSRLHAALRDSMVVLCVIGRLWDPKRLWEKTDFVRQEIAVALSKGRPVIPLLFDGAGLPPPEDLPDECRPMLQFQAMSFDSLDRDAYEHKIQQLPRLIDRLVRAAYAACDPQATSQIQINGAGLYAFKAYVDGKVVETPYGLETVRVNVQVGFRKIRLEYTARDNDRNTGMSYYTVTLGECHNFFESGTYVLDIRWRQTWPWPFVWVGKYYVEPPRKL